ncbi:MAG: alpha-glucosidase family protein [Actinomycetia bacterium]|nr:alpha-glucosidase family protein [Actinomycetes bacterium]
MEFKQLGGNAKWWRGGTIYQIYPRSYGDSNGDGIGDLRGIIEHLDYVASLGVDAIWLSPFFLSPMKDFGYDVTDHCAIDPQFGTMDDMDALIAEAHRRELRIMIDLVLSHTASDHAWFKESRKSADNPYADWFVWADAQPDGTPPTNWLSVFGGSAWEWATDRQQYYLHNFLISQPDINFHCPDARQAQLDVVKFWLDKGIDGFRLDTINFYYHDPELRNNGAIDRALAGHEVDQLNPYGWQDHKYDRFWRANIPFLQDFRRLLDAYPATAAVGEVGGGWESMEIIAAYTGGNDKMHMCYGFDFLGEQFSPSYMAKRIELFEDKGADSWICWAFSNHDVRRTYSRMRNYMAAQFGVSTDDLDAHADAIRRLGLVLLSCMRGTVCIYQGEELGLQEADVPYARLQDPFGIRMWPGYKGRDGCRTPMPWTDAVDGGFGAEESWLPLDDQHRARAVAVQEADAASTLAHARQLLAWRKANPVFAAGDWETLDATAEIFAFRRRLGNSSVLVVANLSPTPVEWGGPSGYARLAGYEITNSASADAAGLISLAAYGIYVGSDTN